MLEDSPFYTGKRRGEEMKKKFLKTEFEIPNTPQKYCKDCRHYLKYEERCDIRDGKVGRKNYCNKWDK